MSGFLYYLSGVSRMPHKSEIEALGDVEPKGYNATLAGPDSMGGVVFKVEGRSKGREDLGYYPDKQDWEPFCNGKLWVSTLKDDKPKPDDLKRNDSLPGSYVKLGDDNLWEIPTARKFEVGSVLPQAICISNDGGYMLVPVTKYLALQQDADDVFNDLMIMLGQIEGASKVDTIESAYKIALRTICVNYNISELEIASLKLFTTANCYEVLKALIDYSFIEQVSSKKN